MGAAQPCWTRAHRHFQTPSFVRGPLQTFKAWQGRPLPLPWLPALHGQKHHAPTQKVGRGCSEGRKPSWGTTPTAQHTASWPERCRGANEMIEKPCFRGVSRRPRPSLSTATVSFSWARCTPTAHGACSAATLLSRHGNGNTELSTLAQRHPADRVHPSHTASWAETHSRVHGLSRGPIREPRAWKPAQCNQPQEQRATPRPGPESGLAQRA